jgi:hypothetical protein
MCEAFSCVPNRGTLMGIFNSVGKIAARIIRRQTYRSIKRNRFDLTRGRCCTVRQTDNSRLSSEVRAPRVGAATTLRLMIIAVTVSALLLAVDRRLRRHMFGIGSGRNPVLR